MVRLCMETDPKKLREKVLRMPKRSLVAALADRDQPYPGKEKPNVMPKGLHSFNGPGKEDGSLVATP